MIKPEKNWPSPLNLSLCNPFKRPVGSGNDLRQFLLMSGSIYKKIVIGNQLAKGSFFQ